MPDRRACEADFRFEGDPVRDPAGHMGASVAGWGDWNNDSVLDMTFGGAFYPPDGDGCGSPLVMSLRTKTWISLGCQTCVCTAPGAFCHEPYAKLIQLRLTLAGDPDQDGRFGHDVCFVGDLDAPSTSWQGHEIAVSAPTLDTSVPGVGIKEHAGVVYVFFVRGDIAPLLADTTIERNPEAGIPGVAIAAIRSQVREEWFGHSIAGCGDVIPSAVTWGTSPALLIPAPDLLIGAPGRGQPDSFPDETGKDGAAYVVDGSAIRAAAGAVGGPPGTLWLNTASGGNARRIAGTTRSRLGFTVSGLGDLDGDTYNEVAIAAPEMYEDIPPAPGTCEWKAVELTPGVKQKGYVKVVGWAATSHAETFVTTITGHVAGDYFGRALSGMGALPGIPGGYLIGADMFPDLLIGAPMADPTHELQQAGKVYLISGAVIVAAAGTTVAVNSIASVTLPGGIPGEWFGWSLAGGGRLDDDYLPEFAVGSRKYSDARIPDCLPDCEEEQYIATVVGRVQVFCGASFARVVEYVGEQQKSRLGWDVAWLGYLNGGSLTDLVATAHAWAPPELPCPGPVVAELGRVYVFLHQITP